MWQRALSGIYTAAKRVSGEMNSTAFEYWTQAGTHFTGAYDWKRNADGYKYLRFKLNQSTRHEALQTRRCQARRTLTYQQLLTQGRHRRTPPTHRKVIL